MKFVCIAVGLLLTATSSEAFFKSLVNEQCVASPGNTDQMGPLAIVDDCLDDQLGQRFQYIGKHICNGHCPARCLAVPENSNKVGETLILWENLDDEEGQQWTRHPEAENHWINGHGLCLERAASDVWEWLPNILKQEECDFDNENQRFEFFC